MAEGSTLSKLLPAILILVGLMGAFFLGPSILSGASNAFSGISSLGKQPSDQNTGAINPGDQTSPIDFSVPSLELSASPYVFLVGTENEFVFNVSSDKNTLVGLTYTALPETENGPVVISEKVSLDCTPICSKEVKWSPKDVFGYVLPQGYYRITVEGNGLSAKSIEVRIVHPIAKAELLGKEIWPEKIEVGLTPSPSRQSKVVKVGFLHPLVVPSATDEAFLLAPKTMSFSNPYLAGGEVSFRVDRETSGEIPDFMLTIVVDFSNFFGENILPDSIEGDVLFDFGPPFSNSKKSFPLKINLNEPGAIVYKSGENQTELNDYLSGLAYSKGWALIPVSAAGSLESKKASPLGTAFFQSSANNNPKLVVTGTGTVPSAAKNSFSQKVKAAILQEYSSQPFTHLLIVGSSSDIPLSDADGNALDLSFYANVDTDPFAELSVGRIPTSNVPDIMAYYEGIKSHENLDFSYAYVRGNQRIYHTSNAPELSEEEKINSFIRHQFLFTGFSPAFDKKPNGFNVTEVPSSEAMLDVFSLGCQNHLEGILFSSQHYCLLSGLGVPFGVLSNTVVSTKEIKQAENDKIIDEQYAENPNELFSVLPKKISPGILPSAGISFRDYANGALIFNGNQVHSALIGDPSNVVYYPTGLFDAKSQASMRLEGDKAFISFPQTSLNGLLGLGEDKPFTKDELSMINEGHFAKANATIIENEYPFVKEAELEDSPVVHVLALDKDELSDDDALYSDLIVLKKYDGDVTVSTAPEPIFKNQAPFNFSAFKRVALEVRSQSASHAEVLSGEIPKAPVGVQQIDGKEFDVWKVALAGDGDSDYPLFFNAKGQISFSKKRDGTVSFTTYLENIEKNLDRSTNPPNTKLIFFTNYRLVLENSKTKKQKTISEFSGHTGGEKKIESFNQNIKLEDYDLIRLYGTPPAQFASFSFLSKPLLSGKLKDAQGNVVLGKNISLKNIYGMLEYANASVELSVFSSKAPTSSEVFFKVEKSQGVQPLSFDPVYLLETENEHHEMLTDSVKATVQKIFEKKPELREKFSNPANVLLLNGNIGVAQRAVFIESAYFLSNGITLVPFDYGSQKSFEMAKASFEATNKDEVVAHVTIEGESRLADVDLSFFEPKEKNGGEGFEFAFGMGELLSLEKDGALEKGFELEIGGFAKPFENIVVLPKVPESKAPEPPAEPQLPEGQSPPQVEPVSADEKVSIALILTGAAFLDKSSPDFDLISEKPLTVFYKTSLPVFDKAQLFIGDSVEPVYETKYSEYLGTQVGGVEELPFPTLPQEKVNGLFSGKESVVIKVKVFSTDGTVYSTGILLKAAKNPGE